MTEEILRDVQRIDALWKRYIFLCHGQDTRALSDVWGNR